MDPTRFINILNAARARRGLTWYRLAHNSGIGEDTLCKLRDFAKYRRHLHEAQALRLVIGLRLDERLRRSLLDLIEEDETTFLARLGDAGRDAGVDVDAIADAANVGRERLREVRDGQQEMDEAMRLRLVVPPFVPPEELRIFNLFLQAGGFYTITGLLPWRRSA